VLASAVLVSGFVVLGSGGRTTLNFDMQIPTPRSSDGGTAIAIKSSLTWENRRWASCSCVARVRPVPTALRRLFDLVKLLHRPGNVVNINTNTTASLKQDCSGTTIGQARTVAKEFGGFRGCIGFLSLYLQGNMGTLHFACVQAILKRGEKTA